MIPVWVWLLVWLHSFLAFFFVLIFIALCKVCVCVHADNIGLPLPSIIHSSTGITDLANISEVLLNPVLFLSSQSKDISWFTLLMYYRFIITINVLFLLTNLYEGRGVKHFDHVHRIEYNYYLKLRSVVVLHTISLLSMTMTKNTRIEIQQMILLYLPQTSSSETPRQHILVFAVSHSFIPPQGWHPRSFLSLSCFSPLSKGNWTDDWGCKSAIWAINHLCIHIYKLNVMALPCHVC